jgi:Rab-GTPase-TBC domain
MADITPVRASSTSSMRSRLEDWRSALQRDPTQQPEGRPAVVSSAASIMPADLEAALSALPTQFVIDAKRAFHFDVCNDWGQESRKRDEEVYRLACTLDKAFSSSGSKQSHHYYQGLHDVASVLLLSTNDELESVSLLKALMRSHLQPFVATSMATTCKILDCCWRLLEVADRPLHHQLESSGIAGTPVFALSWLITWFSHDIRCFANVQKLFDELIPGHPMLIVYVIVALLHCERDYIINTLNAEDPSPLFAALKRLPQRIAGEQGLHGSDGDVLARSARRPPAGEEEEEAGPADTVRGTPRPGDKISGGEPSSSRTGDTASTSTTTSTAKRRRRTTPQTALIKRGSLAASETFSTSNTATSTSITPLVAVAKLMFRLCPPFVLLASSPSTGFGAVDWPVLASCSISRKGPQAGRCRNHTSQLECWHSSSMVQLVDPSLRLTLENGTRNVAGASGSSTTPISPPSPSAGSSAKASSLFSPKTWLNYFCSNPTGLILAGSTLAVILVGVGLALQRQAMYRRYMLAQQQLVSMHRDHPCLLEAPDWVVSIFRGGGSGAGAAGGVGGGGGGLELSFLEHGGLTGGSKMQNGKALVQELRLLGSSFSYLLGEGMEAVRTAASDGKDMAVSLLKASLELVASINPAAGASGGLSGNTTTTAAFGSAPAGGVEL